MFRGPERPLEGDYIACLGGAGMVGRFLPRALPELIEERCAVSAPNLGQMSCGPQLLRQPGMVALAQGAIGTVIEIVGAHNQSNQFYRVHPRHNDRLVTPTARMRALFPDLDVSEVHFTRHLLHMLQTVAPARAKVVQDELRACWLERMERVLSALTTPVVLVWLGGGPIPDIADQVRAPVPFVTEDMVLHLARKASALIRVEAPKARRDRRGMDIPEWGSLQLEYLPSLVEVEYAADQIAQALEGCLPNARRAARHSPA